jgi:hypothetical protein
MEIFEKEMEKFAIEYFERFYENIMRSNVEEMEGSR